MRRITCVGWALLAAAFAGCGLVFRGEPAQKPDWHGAQGNFEEQVRFLSGVGVAQPGPEEQTMWAADLLAREKLGEAVTKHTRSTIAGFFAARDEYPGPEAPLSQEFTVALTAEVSSSILRQAVKNDTWRDELGIAYVHYRVPVTVVNDRIGEKTRYTVSHINPFGSHAEQAPAQIVEFAEAELRERLTEAARVRPTTPGMSEECRPPNWLEIGRRQDHPPEKYISAVGLGRNLDNAEHAARRELAAKAETGAGEKIRKLTLAEPESVFAGNLRALRDADPQLAENVLLGVSTADDWHDPVTKTHYVLAVLDRTAARVILRRRILDSFQRAGGLYMSGRNHQKAGNYAASLKDYLDGQVDARHAVRMQLQAAALVPEADVGEMLALVDRPLLEEITANVTSLLLEITVEKTGGDGQWMAPGMPPAEPLEVTLTAGEAREPLAGFPVRLALGTGVAKTLYPAVTGQDGTARWQLDRPPPAESVADGLRAELDLGALAPEAHLDFLQPPGASFSYIIRSRANSYFAVCIAETTGDLPAMSIMADRLTAALSDDGFEVLDRDKVLDGLGPVAPSADSSAAQIIAAFAGLRKRLGPKKFLLVAVGRAVTELSETVEVSAGSLHVVHCPFSIKVFDTGLPAGSALVLTASGTGKWAFLESEAEAARRAQEDAASAAVNQVMRGLEEKFGLRRPE